jgi:thioredoxin reductase (NADPH)
METWDVIIVGAGSAGLAAGIYAIRSGLKTLILDEKLAGGNISDAPKVENYPGFTEISGRDLAEKMISQCKSFGVTIRELEAVNKLDIDGEIKTVTTHNATYKAKTAILAMGAHHKLVGVKGEKELQGRGVSYCGICDGPFFKGKHVAVIGGGNSACITALYLSGIAKQVTLIHRRNTFRAEHKLTIDVTSKNNINILWNTNLEEIKGDKQVKTVTLTNNTTNKKTEVAVDAVFIQIGETPNSVVAKTFGIETNTSGYIKINLNQETNFPGIYAAGDITTHPIKQVGTATGQGITAALQAYNYIQQHSKNSDFSNANVQETRKS